MRPRADITQAAILRAAASIVAPLGGRLLIDELRCRDWQALTMHGTRHELKLFVDGPGAEDAASALLARLPDADIRVPGQVVAEVSVEQGTPHNGKISVMIEALAIEGCD